MAKYQTLKQERDDAVARALEAERLSNKAEVETRDAKISVLDAALRMSNDEILTLRAEVSRLRGELRVVRDRSAQALGETQYGPDNPEPVRLRHIDVSDG